MTHQKNKTVPPAQDMHYTLQRAIAAMEWLDEIDKDFNERVKNKSEAHHIGVRRRIVIDSIAMYVTTLVQDGGIGISLINSYPENDFVKEFAQLDIVKQLKLNRHNRAAHESKNYGFFVKPDEILESELLKYLKDAELFVMTAKNK